MSMEVVTYGSAHGQPLMLVHGWGMHAGVWQQFAPQLARRGFNVLAVNLPGYGGSKDWQVWQPDSLVAELAALAPRPAIWCGWSLGGMLASLIAKESPDAVTVLITLCANPRFATTETWLSAMPEFTFANFSANLERAPWQTLKRFQSLTVKGSQRAKEELRILQAIGQDGPGVTEHALKASLRLLAQIDTREILAHLTQPQLHLLGGEDSLVPVSLATPLARLCPQARVEVVDGAGHAPFLSDPRAVLRSMTEFLAGLN